MIADAKFQELNMSFTFQIEDNNKLLINAIIENKTYQAERLYDPDLDFDDIKAALMNKEFKIVTQTEEILKLKICKVITLEFKAKDKIAFNQLKDTVAELAKKLHQQIEKNSVLEKLTSRLNETMDSMTIKMSEMARKMEESEKLIKIFKEQLFESKKRNNLNETSIKSLEKEIAEINKKQNNHHQTNLQQKGEFLENSKIVTSNQQRENLKSFFGNKVIKSAKLLYCASENNFLATTFHQKCDNIPNTLVLCETEHKKKVGGFTPLVWESLEVQKYKTDESGESFMFSLSTNDKFVLEEKSKAILNSKKYGPYFGGGSDLAINNDSKKRDCYAFLNASYKSGNYQRNYDSSKTKFNGKPDPSNSFRVFEWEVWQVEFA